MPLSSLPSDYGIGSCGKSAYEFIDFLDRCGQTCWQVLPLNPTSYGDSPYQSPASVAGNPYFIDLDILRNKGLLTKDELDSEKFGGERVDYGHLFNSRYPVLRKAYARFTPDTDYERFCRDNKNWLDDYSLFMALKVHYNYRQWTLWELCHRDCDSAREHASDFEAECEFWKWVQYEFMTQWSNVRKYANSKGISIIGDMPIYVAHDSMDVWRAPEQFLLDENYNPRMVAGCPPDAYSETGQLWGNPIYNWDIMAIDNFSWWVDRVGNSFALYDLLRIDHFRGFASYYTIPATDPDAMNGKWCDAPGKALFDRIREAYPDGKIIAEDLGFITEDVRELLAYTGFPGMKVIQFAFYSEDSEYLPRMFETDNCLVYTSSHDSDCTKSWYEALSDEDIERFESEYTIKDGQTPTEAVIEMAMGSVANLCMVCLQDYLELSNEEGRMNVPSKAEGNWTWRVSPDYATEELERRIRNFSRDIDRLK